MWQIYLLKFSENLWKQQHLSYSVFMYLHLFQTWGTHITPRRMRC